MLSLGLSLTSVAVRGGGGVAPWHPTDLTGLVALYDISDLSTLFVERTGASASTPSSVDGVVGTVLDPILRSAGGLYWLECDGVDDGMAFTAVSPAMVAVSTLCASSPPSLATLLGRAAGSDANSVRLNNATATYRAVGNSADGADFVTTVGETRVNGDVGFSFTFDVAHVVTATRGEATPEDIGVFGLAATLSRYWKGNYYQIVLLSTPATGDDLSNLVTYLGAKAGLTL